MKVGIGITTYNRKDSLRETLKGIFATSNPDLVLVSDDGSTDGTHDLKSEFSGVEWLFNENGGIARNKNRLLFRLFALERCDVVILMEDDVVPIEKGWFHAWSYHAGINDHVNMRFNHMPIIDGIGTLLTPYRTHDLTGQVIGLSSQAWKMAGYMDPRFTGYGYEHVEYSRRLAKMGMGGEYKNGVYKFDTLPETSFTIDHEIASSRTEEKVNAAFEVLKLTLDDYGYKKGWVNDLEFITECLERE